MGYALETVLASKRVNGAFSRLKVRNTTLQRLFGLQIGGPGSIAQGGQTFSFDIVNPERDIATARGELQTSKRVQPKVISHVDGRFPRSAETIGLDLNKILELRGIGGQVSEVSEGGMRYITENQRKLLQRYANLREFQVAGMMRSHYYWQQTNQDTFEHSFTSSGAFVDMNFQIPAGNLTGLDMTGAGNILTVDWTSASSDILGELLAIQEAFEQVSGETPENLVCSTTTLGYLLANTGLHNVAGSTGPTWREFRNAENDIMMVLQALPWLKIWVISEVLNVNGTVTRLIPDNGIFMFPDPSPDWVQYWEGSEIVVEQERQVRQERTGLYAWTREIEDPAQIELKAVQRGLPILLNPNAMVYGTYQTT